MDPVRTAPSVQLKFTLGCNVLDGTCLGLFNGLYFGLFAALGFGHVWTLDRHDWGSGTLFIGGSLALVCAHKQDSS